MSGRTFIFLDEAGAEFYYCGGVSLRQDDVLWDDFVEEILYCG